MSVKLDQKYTLRRDYILLSGIIILLLLVYCILISTVLYYSNLERKTANLTLQGKIIESTFDRSFDRVSDLMKYLGYKYLKNPNKDASSIYPLFQQDFAIDDKISDFYSLTVLSWVNKHGKLEIDPSYGPLEYPRPVDSSFPLEMTKIEPWQLKVGQLTKDAETIPLAMGIADESQYYGTIVTSLVTELISRELKPIIRGSYTNYLILDSNYKVILSSNDADSDTINFKSALNKQEFTLSERIVSGDINYELHYISAYNFHILIGYNSKIFWHEYKNDLIPYLQIATSISLIFLLVMFIFRRAIIIPLISKLRFRLIKEMEQRIENERMLSHILSNISAFAYRHKMADGEISVDYVSDGCFELTGYKKEDYYGKKSIKHTKVIHPDYLHQVQTTVLEAVINKKPFEISYPIITAHGEEKWVLNQGYPLNNEDGAVFEGFLIDITKLKETENKMSEALRQLKISNQELEQFAYMCSHDLKEPLRTIFGYLKMLRADNDTIISREGGLYIKFMEDASLRMKSLIENILIYSQVDKGDRHLQDVSLNEVVEEVISGLNWSIRDKNIAISNKLKSFVKAERYQIYQLFQNLISNALKFSDSKNPEITIWEETVSNKLCRIYVKDNGIGIEKEFHTSIFEVFKKIHPKDKYEGSGIGLALSKKIIEQAGGRIWVESVLGEGSTFIFELETI